MTEQGITQEDEQWIEERYVSRKGSETWFDDMRAAIARGYERGRAEHAASCDRAKLRRILTDAKEAFNGGAVTDEDFAQQISEQMAMLYRSREKACAERDTAIAERKELAAWRSDVTVALGRPQGAFYADVPKLIRELVADRDRLAKRCGELLATGEMYRAETERLEIQLGRTCAALPNDRLAALEQRVGALVEALMTQGWSSEEFEDRLAALRAPGVDAVAAESTETTIQYQRRKIVALQEQVATARRERDEAMAVVRRCAEKIGDPCKRDCSHDVCWVISESRALVAGQGGAPVAQCQCAEYGAALDKLHAADAEIETCRETISRQREMIATARGLIERAERWISTRSLGIQPAKLLADLRAYLGGG